jgi:hypothetical protein
VDRHKFSGGSVGFPVVHVFGLLETLSAQSGFVFYWYVELVLLDFETQVQLILFWSPSFWTMTHTSCLYMLLISSRNRSVWN